LADHENTIHNERTKLLANALDRASTASLAVGFIAPVVSIGNGQTPSLAFLVISVGVWFLIAMALHMIARRVLGGLRQ
jgi:hypothetical protein